MVGSPPDRDVSAGDRRRQNAAEGAEPSDGATDQARWLVTAQPHVSGAWTAICPSNSSRCTVADHAFARHAVARIEQLLLDAHEALADAELASGRHVAVVGRMSELLVVHPLRERFHAQLILALYRSERQADALRAFQNAVAPPSIV